MTEKIICPFCEEDASRVQALHDAAGVQAGKREDSKPECIELTAMNSVLVERVLHDIAGLQAGDREQEKYDEVSLGALSPSRRRDTDYAFLGV